MNSVLGEAGGHVDGVEAVQDGKVLCQLIDVLSPDAGLQAQVKVCVRVCVCVCVCVFLF